ncbi:MAG TPA: hypothetical protein VE219_06595 [Candidatus Sulfotelmatobacter sp.]|nr:hypothetical protein [Candidatus Sulfotelmatobacter sp.]
MRRTDDRPDGSDSLDVRWRYLRRQRPRLLDRSISLVWVAAAVVGWLFVSGFAGLGH